MITREIRRGELFADRYRVIRRLGTGGMATVWLAEDERLGREVAIKRLNTDAPEESLTRFRREARLGATLNHPNFVSVFDTIATDEGALIVMEYVPGRSLEELGKGGPMDPGEAVLILRGAADALDHAHKAGVVHRDIKPANILVREDGTVKVADLGIARAVDATQITAEGKVIGTVPYMAPERFEAAGAGGPASDVYALAAVAYELLSGTSLDGGAPTRGQSPDRRELAARWPDAPASVFAVVLRGLSQDPAARQRSAGQFVAELEDAVQRGDEDTRPFDPSPADRSTRPLAPLAPGPSRSPRSRVGAVLALTLVALAGVTAAGIALVGGDSGSGASHKKEAKAGRDARGSAAGAGSADGAGSAVVSDGASAAASEPAAVADQASAPSSSSSVDGASLNAQGFSLINQGRAAEAVPILRRAVDSYPEGTTDLNYAYALYNLGNALRLSGQPEEAIPVLERRLSIPNQRSTVAAELARARAEAGTG
jgi:eukaryotic-like serine/threonine-protein kinase